MIRLLHYLLTPTIHFHRHPRLGKLLADKTAAEQKLTAVNDKASHIQTIADEWKSRYDKLQKERKSVELETIKAVTLADRFKRECDMTMRKLKEAEDMQRRSEAECNATKEELQEQKGNLATMKDAVDRHLQEV